jgi:cold shock CspA family protein
MRQQGVVTTFFQSRGFGFIQHNEDERDLFFHARDLRDIDEVDVTPGLRVTFVASRAEKGPMARDVRLAENAGGQEA